MKKIEFSNSRESRIKKRKRIDRLYEKKPYIEFIVAVLSVPSILLLLILNLKSLTNSNNAKPTPTPSQSANVTFPNANPNFFTRPVSKEPNPTLLPNETQAPCIKGLGPVSITSPAEGDTITTNPVEVDISYDDSTYCSAVWAYSINGSNWSDYNNNSVALYNLPNGSIKFQLRVKSLTSTDATTLTRDFTYQGPSSASTASESAH
jgi:hypothetical protein